MWVWCAIGSGGVVLAGVDELPASELVKLARPSFPVVRHSLFEVVDEATLRAVRAGTGAVVATTQLGLVFGMPGNCTELFLAMCVQAIVFEITLSRLLKDVA